MPCDASAVCGSTHDHAVALGLRVFRTCRLRRSTIRCEYLQPPLYSSAEADGRPKLETGSQAGFALLLGSNEPPSALSRAL